MTRCPFLYFRSLYFLWYEHIILKLKLFSFALSDLMEGLSSAAADWFGYISLNSRTYIQLLYPTGVATCRTHLVRSY